MAGVDDMACVFEPCTVRVGREDEVWPRGRVSEDALDEVFDDAHAIVEEDDGAARVEAREKTGEDVGGVDSLGGDEERGDGRGMDVVGGRGVDGRLGGGERRIEGGAETRCVGLVEDFDLEPVELADDAMGFDGQCTACAPLCGPGSAVRLVDEGDGLGRREGSSEVVGEQCAYWTETHNIETHDKTCSMMAHRPLTS